MAALNLKGITKIYPRSGSQKKAKKEEEKTFLRVTEQGVAAARSFDRDGKNLEL